MTLTITVSQATLDALAEEAAARNTTCEHVASTILEGCFTPAHSSDPDYNAWFKAKYEAGMAAYERGEIVSNEEVERKAETRRARLLARIAASR